MEIRFLNRQESIWVETPELTLGYLTLSEEGMIFFPLRGIFSYQEIKFSPDRRLAKVLDAIRKYYG